MNRSEILANRQKWIDFLVVKGRKRIYSYLDVGDGKRCCLGHGCYVFNIPRVWDTHDGYYIYDNEEQIAPASFIKLVGLWDSLGGNPNFASYVETDYHTRTNLTELNDDESLSPRRIGVYLQSVIEGGRDTPFRPLSEYKK